MLLIKTGPNSITNWPNSITTYHVHFDMICGGCGCVGHFKGCGPDLAQLYKAIGYDAWVAAHAMCGVVLPVTIPNASTCLPTC